MTVFSHVLSGSLIALTAAKVDPSQTSYVAAAVISSGVFDLDHIYFLIRDRKMYQKHGFAGHLHKARSVMHELIGFAVVGIAVLLLSFVDVKMAYIIGVSAMVHLAEDTLVGISIPFNPTDKTEISLLPQKKKLKVVIDISVLVIFGFLWIKYLSGQI